MKQNTDSVLIFLVGVGFFTIGLSPEFLGLDCRFAMFAQEMLRNGPTLFPTMYGQPYPDYPSSSTVLIYLVSLPFGKVTKFTAVFPVAVISALILVVTYRIGAMHSRHWGLCAVVLCLFTIEFDVISRSLSPDQYVSLVTALCFYLVYSADVYGQQKRLAFVPLLFVAGFAFRGPLGLVIPAGVLCGYYLYGKDIRRLSLTAGCALIVLIVCSIVLLAAAKYHGGERLLEVVLHQQALSRIVSGRDGFSYYWYQSLAGYAVAYPLAILVVTSRFREILHGPDSNAKFIGYLLLWVVVVMLGLSIPGAKKMRYIAPIIPATALIASFIFMNAQKRDFLSRVKKIFLGLCSWLPAAAFVIIAVWWIVGRELALAFGGYFPGTLLFLLTLAVVGRWLSARLEQSAVKEITLMSIGAFVSAGIIIGIAEPITYNLDRTAPFVRMVESLQMHESGEIGFYKMNPDGDAIKFMVNLDKPIKPKFIDSPQAILNYRKPAYFITREKDWGTLPIGRVKALGRGRIGHVDCVVFKIV